MSIKIRQAVAADAPFLAKMMLQSSRAGKKAGVFDLFFSTSDDKVVLKYLEALAKTTVKNRCHFSNFLVAELDDQPVGSLCSYEPRISNRESFLKSLLEIGYENDISEQLEVIDSCSFNLNIRTLMFDFMEEVDNFRDVGILKALMQKSLLSARLKGYRIAKTIVEIGSLETILFYKKLGFKEIEEQECELYKEKFGRLGLVLLAIEF